MKTDPQFIYVKGDVSGIQGFIFNVKSKHAAKELKGRSFFIKLLIEVAIQYLLDDFNIRNVLEIKECKISTSGGNFILKLPAVSDYAVKINKAQAVFTESLQYTGLNICMAMINKSVDFKDDMHNLNSLGKSAKHKLYQDIPDYFEPFSKINIIKVSEKWEIFTEQIRKSRYFRIEEGNREKVLLEINNQSVNLAGYKISFSDESGIPLTDFLESLFPLNGQGQTKQFEELSESDSINRQDCYLIATKGGKEGLNKLGILALDVDGLGNYLSSLNTEEELMETDYQLKDFFNNQIEKIINDPKFKYQVKCRDNQIINVAKYKDKIYSVTAGGDDSFFVGKWNTMLDFAIELHSAFCTKFPQLSISAGLVIVDPKFPVVRFADLVETVLKKAKYQYEGQKGNICIFGEVIKWEMLLKINHLRNLLHDPNITMGLLAKARLSANSVLDYSSFKLEDFWKMGYYLRDLKDKHIILKLLEEYIENSIAEEKNNLLRRNYRKILPVAARLAELDHR